MLDYTDSSIRDKLTIAGIPSDYQQKIIRNLNLIKEKGGGRKKKRSIINKKSNKSRKSRKSGKSRKSRKSRKRSVKRRNGGSINIPNQNLQLSGPSQPLQSQPLQRAPTDIERATQTAPTIEQVIPQISPVENLFGDFNGLRRRHRR